MLHDLIRLTAACKACYKEGEPIGILNKDTAGTPTNRRRRYKCRTCFHTLSVENFLAVYSRQDSLEIEQSPVAVRPAAVCAVALSAATMPQGVVAQQRRDSGTRRPTSSAAASLVTHVTENTRLAQQITSDPATSPAATVQPTVVLSPAYRIPRREFSHVTVDSCVQNPPSLRIGETRQAEIEAALDRLGLKGINRKRRRTALQVLWAVETPNPESMVRVALACGDVSMVAAKEAVKALKIDIRTVHYMLKTDEGIELLVGKDDMETIIAKAKTNGIPLGIPKPTVPDTRKACDVLLKAITPACSGAKHPHARSYFLTWKKQILDNLPRHPRSLQQAPAHTDAHPDPTLVADIQEAALEDLDCGNFSDSPHDGECAVVTTTAPAENIVSATDVPKASDISINEYSFWMAPKPELCNLSQLCVKNHTITTPDMVGISPQQTEPYMVESQTKILNVSYVNAHGLNPFKLSQMEAKLTINSIVFISETWHIQDAVIRLNPAVMAISPEPYRSSVSRGKGGLTILAHDSISHELRSINTRPNAIWLTIYDLVIAGIYLPPSMSEANVLATLNELPSNTDMVLGDLNARLGIQSRPRDAARCDIISQWCSSRGITLLVPDSEIYNNSIDHILAKPNIKFKDFHIVKAPIITDHPMLGITVETSKTTLGERHTARYKISKLNNKEKEKAFIRGINLHSLNILEIIKASVSPWANHNPQLKVNCLDCSLIELLKTILNNMVGTHKPSGLYTKGATSRPKARDMGTAIKTVRSAQRECNAKCELLAQNPYFTPHQEAICHYTAIYKQMYPRSPIEWNAMNHIQPDMVACEQTAQTIKEYPSGKSPGIDGIDKRVMLLACNAPVFLECLTILFNTCIQTGTTPSRWNVSVITPIPKTGKDPKYIANRRPVALTVLFRRIFEKLILQRITSSVKLNRGQAGFRQGFSCITQVLLAEQARVNGQKIRVFLDLKCAYDSVPIDKLLVKLSTQGLDQYLIMLVESLLSNCSTTIAVNGTLTKEVKLEKGLFQGSLLSPILFDVFIDDLAASINIPTCVGVPKCLLFADDILLTSSTKTEMLMLLDTVVIWCRDNEMTINVPKSGTTHKRSQLFINNEEIPQVNTYRYLGIPLSRKGIDPTDLIEENLRRATGALNLVRNSLASRLWPPATKITIYKLFIRSVLEYAAPILVLLKAKGLYLKTISGGIKKMQALQNDAVKWIFCRKRPLPTLESLAGLSTIQYRFEELTARFRLHLVKANAENPIKYWSDPSRCCGLISKAMCYPIPDDNLVETITDLYKTKSFEYAATKNRLAGYIAQESRLESGMDASLTIQNHKLRNLAINWRCNTFGITHKCGTCKTPFTRRHVSCTQLLLSHALMTDYRQELASNKFKNLYTVLDYLLNKKKFHLFGKCIQIIESRFE
jgi:hypothetical protein